MCISRASHRGHIMDRARARHSYCSTICSPVVRSIPASVILSEDKPGIAMSYVYTCCDVDAVLCGIVAGRRSETERYEYANSLLSRVHFQLEPAPNTLSFLRHLHVSLPPQSTVSDGMIGHKTTSIKRKPTENDNPRSAKIARLDVSIS